jgi:alkyl hydroperoxide reductase subunit AhpF
VNVLGEHEADAVRSVLASVEQDVEVTLELGPTSVPVALLAAGGREIDTAAETRAVVEDVCSLSERVRLEVVEREEPGPWPRTTIGRRLAYLGMPLGYELTTLVHAIVEAGRPEPSLSSASRVRLDALERDVAVDVFVTPTCPHCPPAVLLAFKLALATPRVHARGIEASEFAVEAERHGVQAVPAIVVDDRYAWAGAVPEAAFVDRVLGAAAA